MHRLIWVDTRVLDKNLFFQRQSGLSEPLPFLEDARNEVLSQPRPIHPKIEVPGRRNLYPYDIRGGGSISIARPVPGLFSSEILSAALPRTGRRRSRGPPVPAAGAH